MSRPASIVGATHWRPARASSPCSARVARIDTRGSMSIAESVPPAHPGFGGKFRTIPVDPPAGFKMIDFQRFNDWRNFNTHIGPLYFRRGEKGTSDAFVMGLRVQPYMC